MTKLNKDEAEMWRYWSGKYGAVQALQDYYPGALGGDDVLRQAVAQIRIAELAIEARMKELGAD